MIKFKLYFDKDKETEWLNEMSQKGYAMTGFVLGFYSFDECKPGEYIYQIDITEGMFRVPNDYREFMREMGVEIVSLWGPWVILRKKASEGPFELYSDVESSIAHYEKIRTLFKIVTIVEIFCLVFELIVAIKGSVAALVGLFIIAAMIGIFIRQLMNVGEIIARLQGRVGEHADKESEKSARKPSGLISLGFLFNACGFALQAPEQEFLKGMCHGIALVFFVVGIVLTLWKRK